MLGAVTNGSPRQERAHGRRAARLLVAAAILLPVVLLLGCGGDGGSAGSGAEAPANADFGPNVVTDDEIEAQEDGSPGRALLEWWQSFQFGDAEQVLARTSQETIDELGESDLAELVNNTGQGLQGVEVLAATESGTDSSVRVGLLQFTPEKEGEPPPDQPTASTPDTFTMTNEDGEWLFAETAFLVPRLEGFLQAQAQQEEAGGEQNEPQTTTQEQTQTTTQDQTNGE
jgi:hypothetical protein